MGQKVQFTLLLVLFAFAIGTTKCAKLFICKAALSFRATSDTGDEDCDPDFSIDNRILPDITECGVSDAASSIRKFPWTAIIEGRRMQILCNGALINRRYVLGVPQCLIRTKRDFQVKTVRLGDYNADKDPDCDEEICKNVLQRIPVEKIIIHEGYRNISVVEGGSNHIGLIRLQSNARLTESVSPVCLPSAANYITPLDARNIMIMSGWGLKEPIVETSAVKKNFEVKLSERAQCEKHFKSIQISDGAVFCTKLVSNAIPRIEFYGVGMPLVEKSGNNWFAVGNVANAIFDGSAWREFYNINISYYDEWIRSKLEP